MDAPSAASAGRRQGATTSTRLAWRLAALLIFAPAAVCQIVPGRYVVELAGAPAGRRTASRESVRLSQGGARAAIASHGGTVLDSLDTVLNAVIVNIPDGRAGELASLPGVVRVHPVRQVRMTLDHALPVHQVPAAWAMLALGQNSAGAGVKIGIVDSGIDVNNPAFSDPLPPVAGFPKVLTSTDTRFTNAKIIVAKNYTGLLPGGGDRDADDRIGHGSGTSMAAAGGPAISPYGPIVGVAPKAYLGSYKVLGAGGTSSTDVIAKAVDDAVADGMDVINISIGGYVTSYSDVALTDPAIAAVEAAAAAGVVVTVSAGNDGPGAGTIEDLASAPDVIAAGAINNNRTMGYALRVSGAAPYQSQPGSGPNPGQTISGSLVDVSTIDGSGQACATLPAGSLAGMVALIQRGGCTFESKVGNVAAAGALAAIVYNNAATGLVSMNVGAATLPSVFIVQADGIDLASRIAAAPGLQASLDLTTLTPFATTTDLVDFSSRGPAIGSAMKPDLVAVGENIMTAAQKSYSSGELYDPSGFLDVAGTSYSAPLTAGAAAILKGARPGLTVAQYRSLLINNAGPATSATGVAATVQQAGTGILNVAAALNGTLAAYPASLNFGEGSGIVNQTVNLTLTNLGTAGDTYAVTVMPSSGSPTLAVSSPTVQLDPNGTQQIALTMNASGLVSGEYQGFVQVTGTVNQSPVTIPYWFAVAGTAPAGISILRQDNSDSPNFIARGAVIFRVVDVAGVPFPGSATPQATVPSGDGSVRNVYRTGSIPGTYAVDVRTGSSNLQMTISVGGVNQNVLIPVR